MRHKDLAAASVAVAVGAAALYAGPVFRAALVADLGWSNELAAGAFAFGYLAAGATPIVSGIVADRIGAPWLLVAGLVLAGLGLLGASSTSQPWHWYLAAGVGLSVAYYLVHVGGTLIATGGSARGTAVGVAIGLGVGLGLGGGPVLAQFAVDSHGWRDALTLFGVGALAVAALMARWTRRPSTSAAPDTSSAPSADQQPGDEPGPQVPAPTSASTSGSDRRRLLIGFFLGNALLAIFDESLYQHGFSLGTARGLSSQAAAGLLGLASAGLTVGMLLGGPLSDLVGRQRVLIGAAGLVALAALELGHSPSTGLWLWGSLYGAGLGASIAVRSAAWGDAFAGPGRGRAVGIVASGYPVGAALTIWLGASWLDAGGSYERLYLTAAVAAILWAALGGTLAGSLAQAARPSRRSVSRPTPLTSARIEPSGA
jgi:MFS family permease